MNDLTDQENPISDQCGQKWDFKVHAKNDCKKNTFGVGEGSKLIQSLDEIEAIFVTDDGNIHRVG